MLEPARRSGLGAALLAIWCSGCTLIPSERLEECHREVQGLRAEVAQLKDVSLKLRSHNQDLAQRAVDDQRRIDTLDEENHRLEQSVQAYQDERDDLAAAFEEFKHRLVSSSSGAPAAWNERFGPFLKAHPEFTADVSAGTLTMPVAILFESQSAEWKPGAIETLQELAQAFTADLSPLKLAVAAASGASDIRRTSIPKADDPEATLAQARARRLRDVLARLTGTNAPAIDLLAASTNTPIAPGQGAQGNPQTRIALRLGAIDGSAAADSKP
jgi:outer membrane protein OmpA-like peptidoglycan-associated protein